MKTKSSILLCLLLLPCLVPGFSQQYQWRLGLSTGYTKYQGQLNPFPTNDFTAAGEVFRPSLPLSPESNWNASLEKRLTAGFGLSLYGGKQALLGSGPEKSARNEAITQYQASRWSLGTALVFRSDNGKLLRETSFIAPYGQVGLGWHRWNGQTRLLLADDPQREGSGTAVQPLYGQVEREERFYLDMGLGLRFRLGTRIELFIQTNAQTNGDHFFGEKRPLPGFPGPENPWNRSNGSADWLFQHQLGIKVSFGPRSAAFRANAISPSRLAGRNAPIPDSTLSDTTASETRKMEEATELSENPANPTFGEVQEPVQRPEDLPEYGTIPLPEQGMESRYVPARVETPFLYPYDVEEPSRFYPNLLPPASRYRQGQAEAKNKQIRQLSQAVPPYATRQRSPSNQGSYLRFVPLLPPATIRRPAAPLDSAARNNAADPAVALPDDATATAFPSPPGLRLQAQRPVRPGMDPVGWSEGKVTPYGLAYRFQPPEKPILPLLFTTVYFERDQSSLAETALEKLAAIAETLEQMPDSRVLLKGYADHTGSVAYNLRLAVARTQSVARALEETFGIAGQRIQIGPGAQLIRGPAPAAAPEDRKVEVRILFLNSRIQ